MKTIKKKNEKSIMEQLRDIRDKIGLDIQGYELPAVERLFRQEENPASKKCLAKTSG